MLPVDVPENVVTDVGFTLPLCEVSRQRLEDCSMSWLKIDLDDVGNCVPVCRGGDPRDTCRIEVYHSIK
jgi:hypothetical protein